MNRHQWLFRTNRNTLRFKTIFHSIFDYVSTGCCKYRNKYRSFFKKINFIQRSDDHRRRWDLREYEKKASDRIENLRSVKKKSNDSDDDANLDEDERERRNIEKKVARTLLQAREFKV